MRYAKGSVNLDESKDYGLLRCILHCGFVSNNQLYEFMKLRHNDEQRHVYNWRLRRLASHGFIVRQALPALGNGQFVYSIGANGALLLQGAGEYCLVTPDRRSTGDVGMNVLHSLELNEIHLTLLRSRLPVRWIPATEVRSQNELTSFGYAKDYDAVIEIRVGDAELKFALEYERTPKAEKDYRRIANRIGEEIHLKHLLYLMPNHDLLHYVLRFFEQPTLRIYFGIVREWHAKDLDMPVLDVTRQHRPSLREALLQAPSKCVA
jgi:hypothetical protein